MISFTRYLAGTAELAAVIAALAFAAHSLRTRFIPAWQGAPARLAEAVLALSILTITAQLCGTAGLFKPAVVIPALLLISLGIALTAKRARPASELAGSEEEAAADPPANREGTGGGPPSDAQSGADERNAEITAHGRRRLSGGGPPPVPPSHRLAIAAALAATAFVVALWSLDIQKNYDRGMYGFDTLWYHMPLAASFVQSASTT
ncbi:MAG: hypothetical protein QOG09_1389, partial [Solirubrobacterales bacterium]|nr:hypothetical protein [Solirubrobacterales bacterium]